MNDRVNQVPPKSPCIGVCTIGLDDICEGCFRSLKEISQWSSTSPDRQREIIVDTWGRAKQAGKVL